MKDESGRMKGTCLVVGDFRWRDRSVVVHAGSQLTVACDIVSIRQKSRARS